MLYEGCLVLKKPLDVAQFRSQLQGTRKKREQVRQMQGAKEARQQKRQYLSNISHQGGHGGSILHERHVVMLRRFA
jgi:hypothetical protein